MFDTHRAPSNTESTLPHPAKLPTSSPSTPPQGSLHSTSVWTKARLHPGPILWSVAVFFFILSITVQHFLSTLQYISSVILNAIQLCWCNSLGPANHLPQCCPTYISLITTDMASTNCLPPTAGLRYYEPETTLLALETLMVSPRVNEKVQEECWCVYYIRSFWCHFLALCSLSLFCLSVLS